MKRIAVYARVSTDEQRRFGFSIEAQLNSLREYAKSHNMIIVKEYVDEGISGQKPYQKRPAMSRLMNELDTFEVVVFIRLDRWFRSVKHYYQAQELLEQHRVSWIATQESYETISAEGRFKTNVMLAVAENEALKTSERIRFVFEDKKNRGELTAGSLALGYRAENKKPVPDQETVPVVIGAYDKYIETRSVTAVREWLLHEHGIVRSYSGARQLLSNRHYIGDEGYPAIIDRAKFQRVQEIILQRSTTYVPQYKTYLFSGYIYCAECGSKMKANTPHKKPLYYCRAHNSYGDIRCTHKTPIYEADIEDYLLANIERELEQHNLTISEVEPVKVDANKIKKRMDKLKDLYLDDLIDKQTYEIEYRQLERKLNTPQNAQKRIDLDLVAEAIKLYGNADKSAQRGLWSRLIRRIEINEDGTVNVLFV